MAEHERIPHRVPSRGTRFTHRQLKMFVRRLSALGAVATALLALGAVGFALSEHDSLWYGFRRALDTAATVGGFPQPHSIAGQIVQVLVTLLGVGTLFYALATVTEFFVAGHLGDLLAAGRMQRMIDALADHHIICGFGRVGRQVASDLTAARERFVVIDADSANRQRAETLGISFIEGDAADDVVLQRAGIERARSIIACADSDADNVFITLTARELRGDIAIVARAAIEDTEKKLKRAGADRVISPYKSSGAEMARLALHPQLSGVLDVGDEYRLEEIKIDEGCHAVEQSIGEISGGALIVGLRRDGDFQPQPPADAQLRAGDVVFAMGTAAALERIEQLSDAARPAP